MKGVLDKRNRMFPSVFSDFFETKRFSKKPSGDHEVNSNAPIFNIRETKKEYKIEFAAPGYNQNEFTVKLLGDMLTVSAERKRENIVDSESIMSRDLVLNILSRSIKLPELGDSSMVDIVYQDGILRLVVSKGKDTNPRSNKEIDKE